MLIDSHESLSKMLGFYMGKNTPERQQFIIKNLKVELDPVEGQAKQTDDDGAELALEAV